MKNESLFRLAPHPRDNALYVHIPFCYSKCRYCDFYSLPGEALETMARLVEAELAGMTWFKRHLSLETLHTAYVGGGTPSLLPRDLLRRLLSGVAALSRRSPAEWTVEANPESLDAPFLSECADAGVTRLSVGVQTFSDQLLAWLGRPGSSLDNRRALDLISRRWDRDWSVDLITGIPGQSPAAALADLETVLAAGPGHVSVYTLTLEEGTALHAAAVRGEFLPIPPEEEAVLWERVCDRLEEAGYRQYEVSNFARPGKESRHNLHYWRLDPYIGVGPGAVSTLPGADGRVVRLETTRRLNEYTTGEAESFLHPEYLDVRALLLDHLLMGLRLEEGIDRSIFTRRFGRGLEELLPSTWASWRGRGLAEATRRAWRCTRSGRLLLNTLLKEAAAEGESPGGLAAVRVNWP